MQVWDRALWSFAEYSTLRQEGKELHSLRSVVENSINALTSRFRGIRLHRWQLGDAAATDLGSGSKPIDQGLRRLGLIVRASAGLYNFLYSMRGSPVRHFPLPHRSVLGRMAAIVERYHRMLREAGAGAPLARGE
jgi:hypothetical protein